MGSKSQEGTFYYHVRQKRNAIIVLKYITLHFIACLMNNNISKMMTRNFN